ncbi:hypothetical protein GALL_383280 [mine drainage metagenome]|uniref:Uncharacterized protein n=1 Tax=mine drainage metagenome TaxID=410659 RepID=A0A1J5Q880_9ZZZZ
MGYERIEETDDPELAFDRAMATYLKKGYSKDWINQRLKSIEVRKDLTDEWENRGVQQGQEFAILTDEITKAWSGLSTRQYRQHKDLKKENLRDHMTNMELVLNMRSRCPPPQKYHAKSCLPALKKAWRLRNKAAPLRATPEKPLKPNQASPSSATATLKDSNNNSR